MLSIRPRYDIVGEAWALHEVPISGTAALKKGGNLELEERGGGGGWGGAEPRYL